MSIIWLSTILFPCDVVVVLSNCVMYRKMLEKCISQEEWRSVRKEILNLCPIVVNNFI